jgi:hypothetical protein
MRRAGEKSSLNSGEQFLLATAAEKYDYLPIIPEGIFEKVPLTSVSSYNEIDNYLFLSTENTIFR